jgi:hypothetical protein
MECSKLKQGMFITMIRHVQGLKQIYTELHKTSLIFYKRNNLNLSPNFCTHSFYKRIAVSSQILHGKLIVKNQNGGKQMNTSFTIVYHDNMFEKIYIFIKQFLHSWYLLNYQ